MRLIILWLFCWPLLNAQQSNYHRNNHPGDTLVVSFEHGVLPSGHFDVILLSQKGKKIVVKGEVIGVSPAMSGNMVGEEEIIKFTLPKDINPDEWQVYSVGPIKVGTTFIVAR